LVSPLGLSLNDIYYHQTRDVATPGYEKNSQNVEKNIPGVDPVYGICWAYVL